MTARTLVVTLVFCAGSLWPRSADACRCVEPGAPCEAAWRAGVVFVGHVVAISSSTVRPERRVEFAVVEPFRGLQLSQVTLVTGMGGGDCGYGFRMGESYLVYAHRSADGHLSASICSRTRPIAEAAEDLAYLRSLATIAPGALARVAGRVQLAEHPAAGGVQLKPVPGVAVTATGEGRTFSTLANERGEFELTGLPLGKYEARATAPDGYDSAPRTLEINDPRGCGTTTLYIGHDSRVTGRLVDARGAPVRALWLELLLPADVDTLGGGYRAAARTAADGTFELRLVEPGEYLLGFNSTRNLSGRLTSPRAFFPGVVEPTAAQLVGVSAADRVSLKDFIVPEGINLFTVEGIVVDAANRPMPQAIVFLRRDPGGQDTIGRGVVTEEDGRFAFTIEAGKYIAQVTRRDPSTGETRWFGTARFTAATGTPLVTVTMKQRGEP